MKHRRSLKLRSGQSVPTPFLCGKRFVSDSKGFKFDSTYDEWLPRKDVTDAALIEYERFLEQNASDNGFKGDAQKAYTSFVGADKTFSLLHKPTQGAAEKRTTTRRESRNDAGRVAGSAQQDSAKTSRVSGRVVGRKTTLYSDL